ncbi:MAG: sulfatase-like hydrolase/transferase, partial [Planctomycetes bacterium]|nr:sulfatase-like hydrolase/transferase [Planctomycetota bacterium]
MRMLLFLLVGATAVFNPASHAAEPRAEKPNIVLIVADDLGWTDLGCFGSKYYRTPNVDRLAATGMKFTAAYSCGPNCAPTRACLMSGLYTPRHGIYTVGSGARGKAEFRKLKPAENRTTLDPSFVTVAEALRASGYATAHFGKWHLGACGHAGPKEQGFDFNFGGNQSGSPRSYFSPYRNPQLPDGPKGESLTDRLSEEVVAFVEQHRSQPFFVYLPYYAVHTPLQAKKELAAQYEERKPVGGHTNPVYAAMIETMDTGIGRILETLDRLGIAEETVVVFTSDNGGVGGYRDAGVEGGGEITSQAPLRGGKGMLYAGGVRVPMIVRWPGVTAPGSSSTTPVTSVDVFPTLAEIADAERPKRLDGVSIVPLLRSPQAVIDRDALYWHFPGYLQASSPKGTWRTTPAGAIRYGDWKLIEFLEDGRLELFHLADDIGETRDLAQSNRVKAEELHAKLATWRKEVEAPMPTPIRRSGGTAKGLLKKARAVLAQLEGEIEVAGLGEPVEVLRDRWGVPHIYA